MTNTHRKLPILIAALSFAVAGAQAADRNAKIETDSGQVVDLTLLHFLTEDPSYVRINWKESILIETKGLLRKIPIDELVSVERSGEVFTAAYVWHNEQRSVSGRLVPGFFYGKDEFGTSKFKSSQVKRLALKPAPTPSKVWPGEFPGTLTTTDGVQLPFTKLRRIDPKSDVDLGWGMAA